LGPTLDHMAGYQIPNRDPETLREYDKSFYAPSQPVKERDPEDREGSESRP
jgi:hypothetical protein